MNHKDFKVKIGSQDISNQFHDLHIEQSVGAHHKFKLTIGTEEKSEFFKGNLADGAKKWIGQPLEVEGLFKGVVTSISLARSRSGGSSFILFGHSPTLHLDDGTHVCSFGEKNLKQIIDDVLKAYKGKFTEMDISPSYKTKMKYCVQYRESNFSFINRLAARYGEWFFYDGYKISFGKLAESKLIRLNYDRDLSNFAVSLKTLPVNFKLKAYDYKGHTFPIKSAEYKGIDNEFAQIAFDKSKTDIYPENTDVPIHFTMSEDDLKQITNLRQNLQVNELVVMTGSTSRTELRLGSVIEVVDPRAGFNIGGSENYGKYIITNLVHDIPSEKESYIVHFEAIPKGSILPPLSISPDPPHCEVQEAEVLENNDPKGLGRVRVQFIWQKEFKGEDKMTPWIRVASHSSGGDKGLYIIPEKGDRVLVAFEHNHPERPFVLTSLYNGEAKPEHHDPNNYKKALKTKGGHQILMNDEENKQTMALSSPVDFSVTATEGKVEVAAKKTITIKSESGDITVTTPANISIDAEGNISIAATGDITLEATNINIKGRSSINLAAPEINIDAQAKLSGTGAQVSLDGKANTNIKGGAILNLESPGITNVTGTMLKLN